MTSRLSLALSAPLAVLAMTLLSGCDQIADPKEVNDLKTQVAGLKSRCELLEKRIVVLEKAKKAEDGGSSDSSSQDDSSSKEKDKDKDKDDGGSSTNE